MPPLEMKVPVPATPACARAGDHEHVASDGVALQIDHARVGERRCTPIRWPCNGPPSAIALLGFPSGRYCPVLSSVVAPVTAGSASVPLLVKLLFGPVAEVRYGHPERIAHAVPIGVGEVPQVERAIVEDAVIAAGELHEAGDGAVVDDLRIAGNSAVGQCADAAVIGQGRGAAGRVQDDASGRQTKGRPEPPVRSACQPPITDPPGAMLTVTFTARGRDNPAAELSCRP